MDLLLYLLSFPYRWGCQFKNFLYRRKILKPRKASLPIISIGNIAFGGSEKTPLVMNLISSLIEQGYKPALISRGYKGRWEKRGGILSQGQSLLGSWEDSGDEAFMVAQNFPRAGIFVGKDRLASTERASRLGFDVGVLDDGFQHRLIHRDLDIVLYNRFEKTALREPLSSLRRAHLILMKKSETSQIKERLKEKFPKAILFEYSVKNKGFFSIEAKGEKIPVEKIRSKKILAFCGIARPERFSSLLDEEGIDPEIFLKFQDHHPYPPSSIQKIIKEFEKMKADVLLTTEKDAVKVADNILRQKIPFSYLKIDLDVEKEFYETVLCFLKTRVH